MRYSGSLVKKEREQIFKQFLDQTKLKFNEIEKELKIRSNMVSYHLTQMQKEGLLQKKGDFYSLTAAGEKYLPIFSHVIGAELGPLPVVLVAVMNKDKILLIQRNKRPYKNYWSMIGGKMKLEESFVDTALRLVKEKSGLDGKFVSINSVLHERVEGEGMIKHSFILFFVKVEVQGTIVKESEHGKLKWFKLKELEGEKIIPSDLWLIQNKLNSKLEINSARMEEKEGELKSFRLEE
ncbi:MAG: NUDIX domain-containing protein [Candidatus Woesearchaeota archaeon]